MEYGYKRQVKLAYNEAVKKVREELQKEGFGVLTEIDVKATLKKKLDVDYGNYVILGACNPPFAYQALQAEKDIGLLLPCNVIVYEEGAKTFVAAILPTGAMSMVENEKLAGVARQVEAKLKKVIERHSYLYYVKDAPEIEDSAYDSLIGELIELEKNIQVKYFEQAAIEKKEFETFMEAYESELKQVNAKLGKIKKTKTEEKKAVEVGGKSS